MVLNELLRSSFTPRVRSNRLGGITEDFVLTVCTPTTNRYTDEVYSFMLLELPKDQDILVQSNSSKSSIPLRKADLFHPFRAVKFTVHQNYIIQQKSPISKI